MFPVAKENKKQTTDKQQITDKGKIQIMATKIKATVTLVEEMLGSAPSNPEVYSTYIASKNPNGIDKSEAASVEGTATEEDRGITVFPRDAEGKAAIYDYQVKGFFKDACGILRMCDDTESGKLKAYKKCIDGAVFVYPRMIRLNVPEGKEIGFCERPLRAETMQGPRVSLAKSETVPEGTTFEFEVELLKSDMKGAVLEWLDYASKRGFGQWRNSGKGRATVKYEVVEDKKPSKGSKAKNSEETKGEE